VFVDRNDFEAAVDQGRFLEWAEYLGNLYGTPLGDPETGTDLLLEIDLQGARSVRRLRPEALLILLKAPSAAVQEERLRARGDDEGHIADRLRSGMAEEREGQLIADAVVVNDDVTRATAEVAGIVEGHRVAAAQAAASLPDEPTEGP
jgi:guanylate kinase